MSKIPIVAIVGRTNAGKSSLLNALTRSRTAITAAEEGTTRDSVWCKLHDKGKTVWLVDTAGLKDAEDEYESNIEEVVKESIDLADLVLYVVDGSTMADELDMKVFKKLRKSEKPVIMIMNKADRFKTADDSYTRFRFNDTLNTSATQRIGIADLKSTIFTHSSTMGASSSEISTTTIAIVGRPNTGKSTLFNALIAKQQAITSNSSGTTRDINRRELMYHKQPFELLDTAGIKRTGRVGEGVERFSYLKSLWAIENSDICVLALDATEPAVHMEQKLAGLIDEAGKGLIIAVTKWDLLPNDPKNGDKMLSKIRYQFRFVDWASIVFTSAVEGRNVSKILEISANIKEQRQLKATTKDLNQLLSQLTASHPPAGLKSVKPRLKYAVQRDVAPTAIMIYGRHARKLHPNYMRYLQRGFREHFDVSGTPIKLYYSENE